MRQLLVLDKNGHSTITENVDAEFHRLIKSGYAAFVNSIQVTELPIEGDILMLSPLAGG
jgi:hypothetical protein